MKSAKFVRAALFFGFVSVFASQASAATASVTWGSFEAISNSGFSFTGDWSTTSYAHSYGKTGSQQTYNMPPSSVDSGTASASNTAYSSQTSAVGYSNESSEYNESSASTQRYADRSFSLAANSTVTFSFSGTLDASATDVAGRTGSFYYLNNFGSAQLKLVVTANNNNGRDFNFTDSTSGGSGSYLYNNCYNCDYTYSSGIGNGPQELSITIKNTTKYLANGNVRLEATTYVTSNVSPVPEPETYALLLAGLGVIATVVRRRIKQA